MTPRRAAFYIMLAILFFFFGRLLTAGWRTASSVDQDACVLEIGPDVMHLTTYQPVSADKKFCEDIPATGATIFVFDYEQSELRDMAADFRIARAAGETDEVADIERDTVAYLPPKVYPTGTLSFEHVFDAPGNYVGIVTADGTHGEHWVSRFSFSVAKNRYLRTPYYLLAIAAALAL
ncbi:MAG: hypothetical protein HYZ60_06975, partial [Methylocystis sp.]|nr:hypothetical protein [Methylocystis sp.]